MTDKETIMVPLETYLNAGVHIGLKQRSKYMARFIYRTNPDGLSILNLQEIDKRIGFAGKFLAKYEPQDIVVVGRRSSAEKGIKVFSKAIGCKAFPGRYKAGIITNPLLSDFFEPKLMLVASPWLDKNAIRDAVQRGIPILALVNSNNVLNRLDFVVPCNNRGEKSIGLVFYLLAKGFLEARGDKQKADALKVEDFGA